MPQTALISWRRHIPFGMLMIVAAIVLTVNLAVHPGQPDELETSLLASEILQSGVPRIPRDGSWHYPFAFDWVNDDDVWVVTPWLDEYVAACGMAMFGLSIGASRLPFVLVAFVALIVFYRLAIRAYGSSEAGLLAVVLLLSSTMFLLLVRQSRYYSLAVLGEVLILWGSLFAFERRVAPSGAMILAGCLIQFFTNYIFVAVNALALGFVALLGIRAVPSLFRSGLMIVVPGMLITAGPWLWYARSALGGNIDSMSLYLDLEPDHAMKPLSHVASKSFEAVAALNDHVVPLAAFVLIGAWYAFRRTGAHASLHVRPMELAHRWFNIMLISIVASNLLVLSLSPIVTPRYFLILCPAASLLLADLVARSGAAPWLRWTFVFAIVASHLVFHPMRLSADSAGLPRNAFDLVGKWVHLDTPGNVLARYLRAQGRDGDRVLTVGDCLGARLDAPSFKFNCAEERDVSDEFLPEWILTSSPTGMDHNVYTPLPSRFRATYEQVILHAPLVVRDQLVDIPFRLYRRISKSVPQAPPPPRAETGLLTRIGEPRRPAWRLAARTGGETRAAHLGVVENDPDRITISPGRTELADDFSLRWVGIRPDVYLGDGFPVQDGQTVFVRFLAFSAEPLTLDLVLRSATRPHDHLSSSSAIQLTPKPRTFDAALSVFQSSPRSAVDYLFPGNIPHVTVGNLELFHSPWSLAASERAQARLRLMENQTLRAEIAATSGDLFAIQLKKAVETIIGGRRYVGRLRLRADSPRKVIVSLAQRDSPFANLGYFREFQVGPEGIDENVSFIAQPSASRADWVLALGDSTVSLDLEEFTCHLMEESN